jgi:hypothetical protein
VEGLALQLVERLSEISDAVDMSTLSNTCSDWSSFAVATEKIQEDTGI